VLLERSSRAMFSLVSLVAGASGPANRKRAAKAEGVSDGKTAIEVGQRARRRAELRRRGDAQDRHGMVNAKPGTVAELLEKVDRVLTRTATTTIRCGATR